jgi:hypothetical protein
MRKNMNEAEERRWKKIQNPFIAAPSDAITPL